MRNIVCIAIFALLSTAAVMAESESTASNVLVPKAHEDKIVAEAIAEVEAHDYDSDDNPTPGQDDYPASDPFEDAVSNAAVSSSTLIGSTGAILVAALASLML